MKTLLLFLIVGFSASAATLDPLDGPKQVELVLRSNSIAYVQSDIAFNFRNDTGVVTLTWPASWGTRPGNNAWPTVAAARADMQLAQDTGPTSQAMFLALKAALTNAPYSITITNKTDLTAKLDNINAALLAEETADAAQVGMTSTVFNTYRGANNLTWLHQRSRDRIYRLMIGLLGREAAGK